MNNEQKNEEDLDIGYWGIGIYLEIRSIRKIFDLKNRRNLIYA